MSAVPDVSVVIPTRGRPALLAGAVRDALAQRGVDVEVLVADDEPAPGGLEAVGVLADPRVRLLRAGGRGVAHARNLAVREARAAWVAFLDDDDRWAPHKLARQLAEAERAGAGLVWCGIVVTDAALRPLVVKPCRVATADEALRDGNAITTPSTVLVRTDAVRSAGGFDEGLSALADWDLWLRLAPLVPFAACAEPLVLYREHGGSLSTGRAELLDAELRVVVDRHGQVGGAPMQRWIAAGLRRSGHRGAAVGRYLRTAWRLRDPQSLARVPLAALDPLGTRAARAVRRRREPPPPAWMAELPVS